MKQDQKQAKIEELRTRIDEILFYKWDPIGISGSNSPRDEYSYYIEKVLAMMLEGKSADELAEHLNNTSSNEMFIFRDISIDKPVAELIHAIVHDTFHHPDHLVFTVD